MVVDDDDVDAAAATEGQRIVVARSTVTGQDQGATSLDERRGIAQGEAITRGTPGHSGRHLQAEGAQQLVENGRAGDAIHIVVAEHGDLFVVTYSARDTIQGAIQIRHAKRGPQLRKPR